VVVRPRSYHLSLSAYVFLSISVTMATSVSAAAESAVKKLARLPANTCCPNCGTQKKFGFGTVCIKYLTFVCDACKTSHQAISHRCKSLTMSSWTMEEVLLLKKNGNERARATWLATAPPVGQGGRPQQGDPIETFKAFVVNAYEHKSYYGNGGDDAAVSPATPECRPAVASAPRVVAPLPPAQPAAPPAMAAPTVDLLDFGGALDAPAPPVARDSNNLFDPFGTTTQYSSSNPPPSDPFGCSQMSSVSTPVPASTSTAGPSFDPFGSSVSSTTANSSVHHKQQTGNGFVPSASLPSSTTTLSTFDPFASNGTLHVPGSLGGPTSDPTPVLKRNVNSGADTGSIHSSNIGMSAMTRNFAATNLSNNSMNMMQSGVAPMHTMNSNMMGHQHPTNFLTSGSSNAGMNVMGGISNSTMSMLGGQTMTNGKGCNWSGTMPMSANTGNHYGGVGMLQSQQHQSSTSHSPGVSTNRISQDFGPINVKTSNNNDPFSDCKY
jgi:hypothetical protein